MSEVNDLYLSHCQRFHMNLKSISNPLSNHKSRTWSAGRSDKERSEQVFNYLVIV